MGDVIDFEAARVRRAHAAEVARHPAGHRPRLVVNHEAIIAEEQAFEDAAPIFELVRD